MDRLTGYFMTYIKDSKSAAELLFDRKHQLFLNFNAHTNQAKNSILYLNNQLITFAKNLPLKSTFNYLDVGCGFGDKTLSIIKAIQTYHPVKTLALDPSSQLLSMFKEVVSDQTIDIICSTWEDYHPVTNFDFISSIHTFYYIDNWECAILKMIDNLENDGKICIALRSTDPVCQFRDYFYKKIHNDGRKERNCQELCELLKQLNIQYKVDYVDSMLDISDCLILNEKGKQLIEFILRQPYENLHDISNKIISYFKQIQNNGHLIQRDGYIWISNQ